MDEATANLNGESTTDGPGPLPLHQKLDPKTLLLELAAQPGRFGVLINNGAHTFLISNH